MREICYYLIYLLLFLVCFLNTNMKKFPILIALVYFLSSCHHDSKTVVQTVFLDSLMNNYTPPAAIAANEKEIEFWKNRIKPNDPGMENELRYAGQLSNRF